MKLALRWKITIAFTLLTAVVFVALDATLQVLVMRHGVETMQQSLLTETHLVQRALPAPPWQITPALERLIKELDPLVDARVTLIDNDGRVAADSRDDPAVMGNHADRPERQQAVGQGAGSAVRHSATLGVDMLYVAVAVPESGNGPRPVLRLSRPMTQVARASEHLRQAIWLGFAVAVVLVWIVGLLLSHNLTRPIESLVRVARRVGKGDLQARVEGVHGPDLGELAGVFNSALDSLARAVATSERESHYYAAILQQMSDGVVIVDRQGCVQFINPTFARLFALDSAAVQGRTSEEIALNFELSALLARAMEQVAVQREEVRLLYPETKMLATAVSPLLDEQENVIGAIGLLRDVTDLHRLDEVRREFVANASHELRTPAAAVKALAEALQMGALNDPNMGPRFVQQIVEAADRQTSILDDMMTLTRVERGRESLHLVPVDAEEAFEEAAKQIRPTALAKGVEITTEAPVDDQVFADAAGLHTILLNLLENGVKYTPRGGRVALRGQVAPAGYTITVSDTGLGIPEADQARIFERFYRVDRARDRATGGTGLGLSIVKHLAEAHGGRVSVRSAPGEGSEFSVFFPAPPSAGPASPPVAT